MSEKTGTIALVTTISLRVELGYSPKAEMATTYAHAIGEPTTANTTLLFTETSTPSFHSPPTIVIFSKTLLINAGFLVGAALYGTKQSRQKPNRCTGSFTGQARDSNNSLTFSPRETRRRGVFTWEKPSARTVEMDFTDDA